MWLAESTIEIVQALRASAVGASADGASDLAIFANLTDSQTELVFDAIRRADNRAEFEAEMLSVLGRFRAPTLAQDYANLTPTSPRSAQATLSRGQWRGVPSDPDGKIVDGPCSKRYLRPDSPRAVEFLRAAIAELRDRARDAARARRWTKAEKRQAKAKRSGRWDSRGGYHAK